MANPLIFREGSVLFKAEIYLRFKQLDGHGEYFLQANLFNHQHEMNVLL